jgi:hypothetical protein
VAIVELVLEDRPERLCGGVVEARPGLSHGTDDPVVGAQVDDGLDRNPIDDPLAMRVVGPVPSAKPQRTRPA